MATKKDAPKTDETAVMTRTQRMEALAELDSFDAAVAYLNSHDIQLVTTDDVADLLGDGYSYVDKNALVNIPFIIVDVSGGESKTYGVPYVMVKAVTATNRRVKFTDFGAGFRQEIETFESRSGRSAVGMVAKGGLTPSHYTVEDGKGNEINATTYYLNLA